MKNRKLKNEKILDIIVLATQELSNLDDLFILVYTLFSEW